MKKMTYLLILFLFSIQIQASNDLLVNNDVCSPPTNIQITNTTTYSVAFEWEDGNTEGTSSLFQYTITEDMNPIGGPTTIGYQGSSYIPLSPSTIYNLHLRTLCMGTWSDWESVSFTTDACDTFDMPYIQDFETLTPLFNLVECTSWNVVSGNYWATNQTSVTGFEGNTLQYVAHETQDANSWYIIQNGINIEDGNKLRISFKYASDGNGTEKLRLFMASSIDDLTSGSGMQLADLTFSDNTVTEYVAGPVPFTGTDVHYFGFQAISDADQGIIYIDDFRVEEWICGIPNEIEINDISSDEALISWIPSGENFTHFYQYVVSANSSEPEEGSMNIISTGTNINQVGNLDPNTVYYVYARASCSGVWSDWSEAISFTTLCGSSTPLPVGDTEQTLLENQTLTDLEVDGENLTWYSDSELITEVEDNTVVVNGTTYYVTQTIGNCISDALAVTVTIIDPCADSIAPTGDAEQTLSEGQSLADLEVDGENLTWYSDSELITEVEDNTVVVNGTTYYVTQTIGNCTSDALAVTVTIIDPCADSIAPTGDTEQTLSEGQSLADLEVDGENLTWYSDSELTTEIEDNTVVVNGTTYYVTQTIGNCTSDALAITVEVTLSVHDVNDISFKIYPNPVNDFLNISCDKGINSVEVINMLGQTIISENVNTNQTLINMSGLSSGNYFVKVKVNGITKTVKIIK